MTYEIAPIAINAARAGVLIKGLSPAGYCLIADEKHTQYKTDFGMVTVVTNTWGEAIEHYLLRYA